MSTIYQQKPDLKKAKILNWCAIVASFIIFVLVGLMRRPEYKFNVDADLSFLPGVHAFINIGVSIALIIAFWAIKNKKIELHQKSIYVAVVLSMLFLISYVMYHFTTVETYYCKEGSIRTVYFFFLITHIVLAGLSLPLILFTFIRAYTHQYEKHRKMARWVFPLWLYVAITGPICYFMLLPCFN